MTVTQNERLLHDAELSRAKNQQDLVDHRSATRRIDRNEVIIEEIGKDGPASLIKGAKEDALTGFIITQLKSHRGCRKIELFSDATYRGTNEHEFNYTKLEADKAKTVRKEGANVSKNYDEIGLRLSEAFLKPGVFGVAFEVVKDGCYITSYLNKQGSPIDKVKEDKGKKKEVEEVEEVKSPWAGKPCVRIHYVSVT